jgi:acetoin utilization protein AcuB
MIIEQLISPIVPTLQPTDTGSRALMLMEENNITQIPLVIDDKYIALVKEGDVLDWETPESPLSTADFLSYKPAVMFNGHPYDALRLAHGQNLSVVPVVDEEDMYRGSVTQDSLLKFITETSGIDNPGGIVVIEVEPRNYSLLDIARICESEEVTIISSQLYTNRDTAKFEITIKVNRTSVDALVGALERHSYRIIESYGEQISKDYIVERYNLLMNYLNM